MFKDLTHSYNGTDATLEILILLAVSFLFGMMFAYYLWAPQKKSDPSGSSSPAPAAEDPGKAPASTAAEQPVVAAETAADVSPASVETPVFEIAPVETPAETAADASTAPIETLVFEIAPVEPAVETTAEISGYEEPVSLDFDEPTETAKESPGATEEELAHLEQLLSEASRPLDALDEPIQEAAVPAEETHEAAPAPETTFDLPPFVLEYPIATETPQDDLQKIDGIGPVIERALKNGGIRTYAQLASSSQDDIMEVLLAASERNKRFQALCASWPDQAALARDGRWEELENRRETPSSGEQ